MKVTALIILNFNNYEDTINCIESVEKYNTTPVKLIIIDNASTRGGASEELKVYLLKRYKDEFSVYSDNNINESDNIMHLSYCSLILSNVNDGYARGNNKGLRLAEMDPSIEYVMILNNDVLFVQDIIPSLIERSESIQDSALLSPLLFKRNMEEYDFNCARNDTTLITELMNNFFHYFFIIFNCENPLMNRRYLLRRYKELPQSIKIELPSGSCMFIKKALFKHIEYFDPNTFLYYEENILYRKVKRINRQNYLFTDLKCIHLGAQSTSKISYSYDKMKKNMASPLYYMKNYYGLNSIQFALYKASVYFYLYALRVQKIIKK